MAYFQITEKKNTEVNVRKGQSRIPIDAENKINNKYVIYERDRAEVQSSEMPLFQSQEGLMLKY